MNETVVDVENLLGFKMSNETDKIKHSLRLLKDENTIKRQSKIAKALSIPTKNPHKFAKMHSVNCGDSNCAMCGNPRKFFDEKTLQEKSFDQTSKWSSD